MMIFTTQFIAVNIFKPAWLTYECRKPCVPHNVASRNLTMAAQWLHMPTYVQCKLTDTCSPLITQESLRINSCNPSINSCHQSIDAKYHRARHTSNAALTSNPQILDALGKTWMRDFISVKYPTISGSVRTYTNVAGTRSDLAAHDVAAHDAAAHDLCCCCCCC